MLFVFYLDVYFLFLQFEVFYRFVDFEMKRIFQIDLVSSRVSVQKDRLKKGIKFNILLLGLKLEEGIYVLNLIVQKDWKLF